MLRQDAYGKWQTDKWSKEMEYFIDQHIAPSLAAEDKSLLPRERTELARRITQRTYEFIQANSINGEFSPNMTPSEFELFCAQKLQQFGWAARVTSQSRDQGIDVIAEKAGIRIVIQCKLYSAPVSNKAVQEITAGRAHEQAHFGIVVTNSSYTPAAEQLAATNSILLLHYTDLANLDGLIR